MARCLVIVKIFFTKRRTIVVVGFGHTVKESAVSKASSSYYMAAGDR